MAINKLLVANRGEIACRIFRTAKKLGISTVAVYSEADTNAPHVHAADESVFIGSASPMQSYLSIDNLCQAIAYSGADAVHPGYGFLSESAEFAERLAGDGITFVGPSVHAIREMGNKGLAKRLMQTAGVPCLPGYEGTGQSDTAFFQAAEAIGYPIMVKAAAGGGGRGMRLVTEPAQLEAALSLARAEASSGFANDELILEKALVAARHIEIQIVADNFGHCIHLGERDCSIQRRHQKVIEEAPCASINAELRASMGAAAVKAAQAVDYTGAGTVEFLVDSNDSFYFLEMNTRLQVEHPVTEMTTGYDLVALQIQIANELPLAVAQHDVSITGHAIEARLCAENPARGFMPTTGNIVRWRTVSSAGIRIDTGIDEGTEVTPWYDSMLAKVIAWGDTREQARQRLCQALTEIVLLGPATNQQFLHQALTSESFASATVDTAFIQDTWPDGCEPIAASSTMQAIAIALTAATDLNDALMLSASDLDPELVGWCSANVPAVPIRLSTENHVIDARVRANPGGCTWHVTLTPGYENEAQPPATTCRQYNVEFINAESDRYWHSSRNRHNYKQHQNKLTHTDVVVDQNRYRINYAINQDAGEPDTLWLSHGSACWQFSRVTMNASASDTDAGTITAPMPGLIVDLLVNEGQNVKQGQTLAVLEAMKMQHLITAESGGTITGLYIATGAQVRSGDLLFEVKSVASAETATVSD